MTDVDGKQGASDPDARLKRDILVNLELWTDEYEQVRLDLPWNVVQILMKYVGKTQTLDVYIEFIERLSAILGDEATALRRVIDEDWKKRLN